MIEGAQGELAQLVGIERHDRRCREMRREPAQDAVPGYDHGLLGGGGFGHEGTAVRANGDGRPARVARETLLDVGQQLAALAAEGRLPAGPGEQSLVVDVDEGQVIARQRRGGAPKLMVVPQAALRFGVDPGLDGVQVTHQQDFSLDAERARHLVPGPLGQRHATVAFGRGRGPGKNRLDPVRGLGSVGHQHETEEVVRAAHDRQVRLNKGDLAAEPGLDLGRVVVLVVRGAPDQAIERLRQLDLELRAIREPGKCRQEVTNRLLLAAGQVRTQLGVVEGVAGSVGEERRGRRRSADEVEGAGSDADHQDADQQGNSPAQSRPRRGLAERIGPIDGAHRNRSRHVLWRSGPRRRERLGLAHLDRSIGARQPGVVVGHGVVPLVQRRPSRVGIAARRPAPANCFIIFCISPNCLTSRLTSVSDVPEPAAMRRRLDPLRTVGSRRSRWVIARMIASVRRSSPLSTAA